MPSDYSRAEYNAQARIISRLNEEVRTLREVSDRSARDAERFKAGYDFYMLIQKACKDSPVVAGEFQRFLMTCKLIEDEGDGTPGLTVADDRQLSFEYGRGYYK